MSDGQPGTTRAGGRGRSRSRAICSARSCAARASRSRRSTTAPGRSSAPAAGEALRPGGLRRAHGAVGRLRRAGGLHREGPQTPVILITAFGDVTGAMEAIQRGAYDYVSKPFNVEELRLTVARALERKRLVAEQKAVPSERQDQACRRSWARAPRMLEVYKLVARVAPARPRRCWSVGESGTGKELVARAIHTHSPRAGAPFVPVNCTALSESLLESELFGHARGAFTGAVAAKRGLFETADGGTLFLDEIGDMGPKMQAQLLRTLQDGEVRPVGGSRGDPGRRAPGLRDQPRPRRGGEGGPLPRGPLLPHQRRHREAAAAARARRATSRSWSPTSWPRWPGASGASWPACRARRSKLLSSYGWPGNVRELENAIERAVAVAKGSVVLPSDLPLEVGGGAVSPRPRPRPAPRSWVASSTTARPWPSSSAATSRWCWPSAAATRRRPPRSWASTAARSTAPWNAPAKRRAPAKPTTTRRPRSRCS